MTASDFLWASANLSFSFEGVDYGTPTSISSHQRHCTTVCWCNDLFSVLHQRHCQTLQQQAEQNPGCLVQCLRSQQPQLKHQVRQCSRWCAATYSCPVIENHLVSIVQHTVTSTASITGTCAVWAVPEVSIACRRAAMPAALDCVSKLPHQTSWDNPLALSKISTDQWRGHSLQESAKS